MAEPMIEVARADEALRQFHGCRSCFVYRREGIDLRFSRPKWFGKNNCDPDAMRNSAAD